MSMDTNDHEEAFIEEEFVEEGESPKDAQKKLREKLKDCEAEKQEYLDGWQRTQADMVNSRRLATQRERTAEERGAMRIVESLSAVLDSFESAIAQDSWERVDPEWRKGVEGIYTHLRTILESNGLTFINPTDQPFDPHEHESVSSEPTDDPALDHTVSKTFRMGFKLGDRVIRPAQVVVRLHDTG